MVITRKYWSVLILLAIGCGTADSPGSDSPTQTEMDLGADTADAADLGQTPDTRDPELDQNSNADCELDLLECAAEFQCVWTGESCASPKAEAVLTSPTPLSQTPAELIVESRAQSAVLSLYQSLDGALRGSLTGGSPPWTALVEGKVDEDLGVMELDFFRRQCGGVCEPDFSATGHFDSKQWLFSHATSKEVAPNLFDNFRFEPNDGIKPSRIPGQEFHGYLTTLFDGSPMAPSHECVLWLPKFAENELSVPSLTCGDEENPEITMRAGTLVMDEWKFSFELEAADQTFYFTGLLGHEVGGVITATKPSHMDMERVPTSDIVGFAVFQ